MSSSVRDATAVAVSVSSSAVTVALRDGRTISAPLAWFPATCRRDPGGASRLEADR